MRKVLMALMMAAALAVPAHARASTISYTRAFSLSDTFTGEVAGAFSAPMSGADLVSLPRFSLPGTLEAVQLTFFSTYTTYLFGQASDDRGESFSIPPAPFTFHDRNDTYIFLALQGALRLQLSDPGFVTVGPLSMPAAETNCQKSVNALEIVACETGLLVSQWSWNGEVPVGPLGTAPFIGTDPLNLTFSMIGSLSGLCDSDDLGNEECSARATTIWGGTVMVSYAYTPAGSTEPPGGDTPAAVPEPSTLVLLGIGLVAISRRIARARLH